MKLHFPLLAAVALASAVASAQTVTLQAISGNDTNQRFVGNARNFKVFYPGGPAGGRDVAAGEIRFNVNQTNDAARFPLNTIFTAFCLQVDVNLSNNSVNYDLVSGASHLGATVANNLGKLKTVYEADATVDQNVRRAAFQLAVWELTIDATPFSLGSGNFQAQLGPNPTSSNALTLANTWLGQLESVESLFVTSVLKSLPTSQESQDLLYFEPIPEPATMLALGLGAGLLAARRRRKSA